MTPTPEDLARDLSADLALCEGATPGPWYRAEPPWLPPGCATYIVAGSPDPHIGRIVCDFDAGDWDDSRQEPNDWEDAAFIAAARTGWPAALRRALAAEQRGRELEAELQAVREGTP